MNLKKKIRKVLEESDTAMMADDDINDIDNNSVSFVELPTTDDVKKIGRPSKEICHRPVWKKKRDSKKTRAEQMESKVTTGKVCNDIK